MITYPHFSLKLAFALLAFGSLAPSLHAGTASDLHLRMGQGINHSNYYDGGGAYGETNTGVPSIARARFTTAPVTASHRLCVKTRRRVVSG
jgi:hypothetical protein